MRSPTSSQVRANVVATAWALLAGTWLLGACGSTSEGIPRLLPDPEAEAWKAATSAAVATSAKRPAVTHLGRTLLPRAGMVALGRCHKITEAVGGVEISRFGVDEVLFSMPWDRPPEGDGPFELTVFCGEPGMLPRPGQRAVLLVSRRTGSPNHDIVQSIGLDDRTGAEKLESLRAYLEIEAIPDESERVGALLAHLRSAITDPRAWTRANAALEYGSLARARPDDIEADDAVLLRPAAARASDRDTRRALLLALERAERKARTPVAIAEIPGATPAASAGAPATAEFLTLFEDTESAAARRQVVLDAAAEVGDTGAAVYARALEDEDPRVREAAIVAVGQLGLVSFGERILPLLVRAGEPAELRRSAVRSLGLLREATAVPTLSTLARAETPLGEDACFALARVRDTDAVSALASLLAEARGERMELIEFLLSERFVEQEHGLGR